jgi:hypothetical protein
VALSWHSLLAALPDDAVVKSQPVVPPERAEIPEMAAIVGWRQLTCELSAGGAGLRHLLVVLDATGRPISVGDHVMTCQPVEGEPGLTRYEHESIGGRLEEDGTFNGTHWLMVFVRPSDSDAEDHEPIESHSRPPTLDEIAALKSIVASLLAKKP